MCLPTAGRNDHYDLASASEKPSFADFKALITAGGNWEGGPAPALNFPPGGMFSPVDKQLHNQVKTGLEKMGCARSAPPLARAHCMLTHYPSAWSHPLPLHTARCGDCGRAVLTNSSPCVPYRVVLYTLRGRRVGQRSQPCPDDVARWRVGRYHSDGEEQ